MSDKLKEFIQKVNSLCLEYNYSIQVNCDEGGLLESLEVGSSTELVSIGYFPTPEILQTNQ